MPAELVKEGVVLTDGLIIYPTKLICSKCDQAYSLHYSGGEKNRLESLIAASQKAVNDSHNKNPRHPDTLPIPGF
jgi:hypothetical protein